MKKMILIFTLFLAISCNKNEVDGIKIGNTLVENQSYSENKKLINLIKSVLKLNGKNLSALINFNCGGAAGCYDLGSVITQIVNNLGEQNFLTMIKDLNTKEKVLLKSFIEVGLEFGYSLHEKSTNGTFEKEFPILYNNLK